jgi:hypothetical protein
MRLPSCHNFFWNLPHRADTGQSAAARSRNVIAGGQLQLSESRAHGVLYYHNRRRVVIMSDIQQYLLDYDRNKKEATETAQKSAARTFGGA